MIKKLMKLMAFLFILPLNFCLIGSGLEGLEVRHDIKNNDGDLNFPQEDSFTGVNDTNSQIYHLERLLNDIIHDEYKRQNEAFMNLTVTALQTTLNVQDSTTGNTRLHKMVLRQGYDSAIRLLILGADRTITNNDGLTALQLAQADSSFDQKVLAALQSDPGLLEAINKPAEWLDMMRYEFNRLAASEMGENTSIITFFQAINTSQTGDQAGDGDDTEYYDEEEELVKMPDLLKPFDEEEPLLESTQSASYADKLRNSMKTDDVQKLLDILRSVASGDDAASQSSNDEFDENYIDQENTGKTDVDSLIEQDRYELHLAARLGNLKTVGAILTNRPELLGSVNEFGDTPLHHAAANGHDAVISYLLYKGADKNITDMNGKTAYDLASSELKSETKTSLFHSNSEYDYTEDAEDIDKEDFEKELKEINENLSRLQDRGNASALFADSEPDAAAFFEDPDQYNRDNDNDESGEFGGGGGGTVVVVGGGSDDVDDDDDDDSDNSHSTDGQYYNDYSGDSDVDDDY